MTIKRFLWLLIFLAVLGCDQAQSKFDQITMGMSRPDVERLVGLPTRADVAAEPVSCWIFGDKQVIVQYHKDKVAVKQIAPAS